MSLMAFCWTALHFGAINTTTTITRTHHHHDKNRATATSISSDSDDSSVTYVNGNHSRESSEIDSLFENRGDGCECCDEYSEYGIGNSDDQVTEEFSVEGRPIRTVAEAIAECGSLLCGEEKDVGGGGMSGGMERSKRNKSSLLIDIDYGKGFKDYISDRAFVSNKAAFLAYLSHELRNPLHAVIGLTENALEDTDAFINDMAKPGLLADDMTDLSVVEVLWESLQSLKSYGTYMIGIVNDVLEMARLESGRVTLERIPVDLHSLLTTQSISLTPTANLRGLNLELNIDPSVPKRAITDPLRFSQMIANLQGNAAKFTPRGGFVRVSVREVEGLDFFDGGMSEVEESRGRKREARMVTMEKQNHGGNGCRGRFQWESFGCDGRVTVTMVPPLIECQGCGGVCSCCCGFSKREHCSVHSSTDTLVVDDDMDEAKSACVCEGISFVEVSVSDTGIGISAEALAQMLTPYSDVRLGGAGNAKNNVNIVIGGEGIDELGHAERRGSGLGLPITLSVLRLMGGSIRIESQVGSGTRISFRVPIRKMADVETEESIDDDNDEYFSLGHDRCFSLPALPIKENGNGVLEVPSHKHTVTSPCLPTALKQTVAVPMYNSGARFFKSSPRLAPRTRTQSVLTSILIADDDALNRAILQRMLKTMVPATVVISQAMDGDQAVQMYTGPDTRFSIVFMDLHMPKMDGVDAAKMLRLAGFDAPIIAATASDGELKEGDAVACGIDGVMGKPFTKETVRLVLRQFGLLME
ncbi:hypothetical protein HDU76_006984 [Blyttiomyces sp. JEL0837]|nr:hypothetical protein HDU76_006984 [Blyttiomyces sp. JEL0837]